MATTSSSLHVHELLVDDARVLDLRASLHENRGAPGGGCWRTRQRSRGKRLPSRGPLACVPVIALRSLAAISAFTREVDVVDDIPGRVKGFRFRERQGGDALSRTDGPQTRRMIGQQLVIEPALKTPDGTAADTPVVLLQHDVAFARGVLFADGKSPSSAARRRSRTAAQGRLWGRPLGCRHGMHVGGRARVGPPVRAGVRKKAYRDVLVLRIAPDQHQVLEDSAPGPVLHWP